MRKYLFIGLIFLVTSLGVSFAWYIWSSSTNTIVKTKVCTPEIAFVGGADITANDLKPVLDKEDGIVKNIKINLNNSCDTTVEANVYLELDTLPDELIEDSFKFELWQGSTELSSGMFSDYAEGDIVNLVEDMEIDSDLTTLSLYIYIDGNEDNPASMSEQEFSFTLYGEGTGAVIESNVLASEDTTPSNGNSTFLNSSLLRNTIESISIAENNTVPSGITSSNYMDVSSSKDGSIKMWWTDADSDNLYEVVIGGSNGKVRLNKNSARLFAYLTNVTTLDLDGIDISNRTNLQSMFQGCSNLTSIDLSSFDTVNVTSMVSMFNGCSSLTTLNLTSFNTRNVTNMYQMFYNCSSLTNVYVSSTWTIGTNCNVTNMFAGAGVSSVTISQ